MLVLIARLLVLIVRLPLAGRLAQPWKAKRAAAMSGGATKTSNDFRGTPPIARA